MQFLSTLIAAASMASAVSAGTVSFVSQDNTQRTVVFTANPGLESIPDLTVAGGATELQDFPTGWIGNWYSVSDGADTAPGWVGMLGEVRFDGFAGATYFDVSAIVNPNDDQGVKMLFPKNSNVPLSGCQDFPCSNAYNQPDDIATLSTDDSELVCLLGTLSNTRKRGVVSKMSREFIEQ